MSPAYNTQFDERGLGDAKIFLLKEIKLLSSNPSYN